MQTDELSARRLTQGKRTIPGTLRRADLAFANVVTGHTILLPHAGKNCGKFLWVSDTVTRLVNRGFHETAKYAEYANRDFHSETSA